MATSNTRAKENERSGRNEERRSGASGQRDEQGRFEGNRGSTGSTGSTNRGNTGSSGSRSSSMGGKTRRGTEEE